MSRMFLVWSLLLGLALAGAEWYERGYGARERVASPQGVQSAPTNSEGLVTAMEDGTPPIAPTKQ